MQPGPLKVVMQPGPLKIVEFTSMDCEPYLKNCKELHIRSNLKYQQKIVTQL